MHPSVTIKTASEKYDGFVYISSGAATPNNPNPRAKTVRTASTNTTRECRKSGAESSTRCLFKKFPNALERSSKYVAISDGS